MKKIISVFLMLCFTIYSSVYAAYDYTAVGAGDWDALATWGTATIPGSGDTVSIPIDQSAGGVTINSGVDAVAKSIRLTIKDGLLTMNGGNLTVDDLCGSKTGTQVIFADDGTITGNVGVNASFTSPKVQHILIQAGAVATIDGDIGTDYIRLTGNDPDQTFRLGAGHTLTGDIRVGSSGGSFTGNHGIVEFLGSATVNGNIGTVWAGKLRQLNLSSGTVDVTGNVRSQNYDLKGAALNITGTMEQVDDGTISTQVSNATTYGKITATGTATIPATSTVSVNVLGYVPAGSVLTIVDGTGGKGDTVSASIPVTTNSAALSFTSNSADSEDLTLTAVRNGYNNLAGNGNASAAGSALEAAGAAGASGDMLTVLNTLDSLSTAADVSNALDTLIANMNNGVPQVSQTTLANFLSTLMNHLGSLRLANAPATSGISTGDAPRDKGIWAQGFGSYLHQDPQGSSNGYNATIWGTAMGIDKSMNDILRAGLSFGYASDSISSKDNSGHTDVDSYQGNLYASLLKEDNYLNGALSFAYNQYSSSRHISFSVIDRIANSDYDGQQYSFYLEGGHTFRKGKLELTPLASLKYEHLYLESYTEKDAGSLNLDVNSQNYDFLQSGLGAKFGYPLENKYGTFIPEFHPKWLYDFIGDNQQSSATFTGGGGSFPTNGFRPAKSSLNIGTKFTLAAKNNVELSFGYDFEVKKDFYGHSGILNISYKF
ncbi:MAG: autotransporter domain-containing protein [Candidatus Omnitrophota bacterium]